MRRTKKLLAGLLAAAMLLSLLPMSALAYDQNQVAGYYDLDAQGKLDPDSKSNSSEISAENGAILLEKNINQTGKDTFDITLQVTTSEIMEKVTEDVGASVVLVFDVSSSMDYYSRWPDLKTAANGFINKLLQNPDTKNQVSIVVYGGSNTADQINSHKTLLDWTGDIAAAKASYSGYATVKSLRTAVFGEPEDANHYGATNCQAGFWGADELLSSGSVTSANAPYVVYMSDGDANRNYSRYMTSDEPEFCYGLNPLHWWHGDSCYSGYKPVYSGDHVARNDGGYFSNADAAVEQARQMKAGHENLTLFTVGYGSDAQSSKVLMTGSSNNPSVDKYYAAKDAGKLENAFSSIIQWINVKAQAWTVTDPMGEFIAFAGGLTSGESIVSFDQEDNTLTWNVKADNPVRSYDVPEGNKTTTFFVYEQTYSVKLDTAAFGFVDNEPTAANGKTTLAYYIDDGEGVIPDNPTLSYVDFRVPGVKGVAPQVPYSIQYVRRNLDGTQDTLKVEEGSTRAWATVSVDEDYLTKYDSDNLVFASISTGNTTMVVTPGQDNVMQVFYDPMKADVTVEHWYRTITDGNQNPEYTYGSTTDDRDQQVGKPYSATTRPQVGQTVYTCDNPEAAAIESVSRDGNKIRLNYTSDGRSVVSATVSRVYQTQDWELVTDNDTGLKSWVLKDVSNATRPQETKDLRAGTNFDTTTAAEAGFEQYAFKTATGDGVTLSQDKNTATLPLTAGGNNSITLNYYKDGPEKPVNQKQVQVTVNYNYVKTTTTVVDGVAVTETTSGSDQKSYDRFTGEDFRITDLPSFNGETYTPDRGNAEKLTLTGLTQDVTVELYYNLTQKPAAATIAVEHNYYDSFLNTPAEGEPFLDWKPSEENAQQIISYPADGAALYEGEHFLAPIQSVDGYQSDKPGTAERTVTLMAGGNEKIVINYYHYTEDTSGTVDVVHNYYTELETVVDGAIGTMRIHDNKGDAATTQSFTDQMGTEIGVEANNTYGAHSDYTLNNPELAVPYTLKAGTNNDIVLTYTRQDSNLDSLKTSYTVQYEYYDWVMDIEDGVAGYYGEPTLTEQTEPVTVSDGMYEGLNVTITDGAREGYGPYGQNPKTDVTLAADGNSFVFKYFRYAPLPQYSVTVQHVYNVTVVDAIGNESPLAFTDTKQAEQNYYGLPFTAEPQKQYTGADGVGRSYSDFTNAVTGVDTANTDELTGAVTVDTKTLTDESGNITIIFTYTLREDGSVPAGYRVAHIYNTYNQRGELVSSFNPDPDAPLTMSYATLTATGTVSPVEGFDLADVQGSGEVSQSGDAYTITLVPGNDNLLTFTYSKTIDNRVNVTVRHSYYVYDGSLETPEYKLVGDDVQDSYKAYAGDEFTATDFHTSYGDHAFTQWRGEDERYTITVMNPDDAGANNVITVKYARDLRESVSVTVNYQYFTFDRFTGQRVEDAALAHSDGFTGVEHNLIPGGTFQVPERPQTDYVRETAEGAMAITLTEGANTATVTYLRTIDTTPSNPGPGPVDPNPGPGPDPVDPNPGPGYEPGEGPQDPVTPPVEIPEDPTPLAPAPETEEEVAIEEEDVPLDAAPVEEEGTIIVDEEVPLGDLPQTGSQASRNLSAAAAMLALSALTALVGAGTLRLKKKEDQ